MIVRKLRDAFELGDWLVQVLAALEDIGQRSGGRYPAEAVCNRLLHEIGDDKRFGMWIAIAPRAGSGVPPAPGDLMVGLMTVNLGVDELGNPVALISRGWVKNTWRGEHPFDAVLPALEAWARVRGCFRLISRSERCGAGVAPAERLSLRYWLARMSGLRAYAAWIGQRGFVMRETSFEKALEPGPATAGAAHPAGSEQTGEARDARQ